MNAPQLKQLIKEEIVRFLQKEDSATHLYKIEGVLVTNSKIKTQTEILSDIRSITGITIVDNREYDSSDPTPGYMYNRTTIKIDPYPFIKKGENFNIDTIKQVIEDIKSIRGVIAFRTEPKLLNIGI